MEENSVKTQKFIIKYFTEIMIKGETAKRQMINQLFFNLQRISNNISSDIKIKKFFYYFLLVCPAEFSDNLGEKLLETTGFRSNTNR